MAEHLTTTRAVESERGAGPGVSSGIDASIALGGTSAASSPRGEQVELILSQVQTLPTLSPVAARLLTLTSADDSDFDEIVALIEADLSLTTRMLALCRRAAAGVGSTVTTVKRAVVLLGLEAVQSAVLSVSVFDAVAMSAERAVGDDANDGASGRFDRAGLWKHSLAVACCAELLARQHPELKVRHDEAFTAGLVHDLGKVALACILPRSYERVLEAAEARAVDLATIERQILGVDHHLAGKRLAEHWGLPYMLADTMWLHGQPASALPNVPHAGVVGLVTAADAICRRLHLGWSGNPAEPPAPAYLAQCGNVSLERVKALEPRLHEALAQRCADLGLGETSTPSLMMESISAANARLHGLTQSLARRAAGSRRHAEALTAVRTFLEESSRLGSIEEVLRAVAGSFVRWGQGQGGSLLTSPARPKGQGGAAVVFQSRTGEAWLLGALAADASGTGSASASAFELHSAPAPTGPEGQPIDLGELARDASMGAASDLLGWLTQATPAPSTPVSTTGPSRPIAGGLDLRRLKRLPIAVVGGAAALLLHDRDITGPGEQAALDALAAAWSSALAGASKQLGARRLSEALADANRRLVDAQSKLTEGESLARLGELAAGAAHEMNNPLTVISGRGQLLAARLKDARDRADAEEIARAAGRLTDLITSLHALASPPTLAIEPTNLPDLLERATRRAKDRVATETGDPTGASLPSIRLMVGSSLALAALDPSLFGRAIEELVTNALQSGAKKIEMHLSNDVQQGTLVLRIKDDGRGLTEHAASHAFDPFFSEKPAGRRPGMGLAMARRYVGLHGGSIDLRSAGTNQGATATITLPRWKHETRLREAA